MNSVKESKEKIQLYDDYLEKLRDVNKHMITLSTTFIMIILLITNVMVVYFSSVFEPNPYLIIFVLVVGILPILFVIISLIVFIRIYQPSPVEHIADLEKKAESLEKNYEEKQKDFRFAKILFFMGIFACLVYIIMIGIRMQF